MIQFINEKNDFINSMLTHKFKQLIMQTQNRKFSLMFSYPCFTQLHCRISLVLFVDMFELSELLIH